MTLEKRIKRLEDIVLKLSEKIVDHDNAWQSWADPFNSFIEQIEKERLEETNKE